MGQFIHGNGGKGEITDRLAARIVDPRDARPVAHDARDRCVTHDAPARLPHVMGQVLGQFLDPAANVLENLQARLAPRLFAMAQPPLEQPPHAAHGGASPRRVGGNLVGLAPPEFADIGVDHLPAKRVAIGATHRVAKRRIGRRAGHGLDACARPSGHEPRHPERPKGPQHVERAGRVVDVASAHVHTAVALDLEEAVAYLAAKPAAHLGHGAVDPVGAQIGHDVAVVHATGHPAGSALAFDNRHPRPRARRLARNRQPGQSAAENHHPLGIARPIHRCALSPSRERGAPPRAKWPDDARSRGETQHGACVVAVGLSA